MDGARCVLLCSMKTRRNSTRKFAGAPIVFNENSSLGRANNVGNPTTSTLKAKQWWNIEMDTLSHIYESLSEWTQFTFVGHYWPASTSFLLSCGFISPMIPLQFWHSVIKRACTHVCFRELSNLVPTFAFENCQTVYSRLFSRHVKNIVFAFAFHPSLAHGSPDPPRQHSFLSGLACVGFPVFYLWSSSILCADKIRCRDDELLRREVGGSVANSRVGDECANWLHLMHWPVGHIIVDFNPTTLLYFMVTQTTT